MNKAGQTVMLLSATLLFLGCVSGRDPGSAPPTATPEGVEADLPSGAADLRSALRRAVDDRSAWGSLHLTVGCAGDAGMRSVEVFGSGVGIWDLDRQFELPPAEISALLRTLDEADFASFADIYGGRKSPDPRRPDKEAEEGSALRVICRVVLSLAGQTKQSAQLGKGEQSAELKRLAEELLGSCQEAGQAGLTAADLADGLEKVSRGELAPETFRVLLHRKPEPGRAEEGAEGFLLQVAGGRATSRSYVKATLQEPVALALTSAQAAELAGELLALSLAELPVNLYARDYTDLSVEVLDHKKSVQARQFAGMTPTTHGGHQLDLDRIVEALGRLHLQVLSAGEPAHEPGGSR